MDGIVVKNCLQVGGVELSGRAAEAGGSHFHSD